MSGERCLCHLIRPGIPDVRTFICLRYPRHVHTKFETRATVGGVLLVHMFSPRYMVLAYWSLKILPPPLLCHGSRPNLVRGANIGYEPAGRSMQDTSRQIQLQEVWSDGIDDRGYSYASLVHDQKIFFCRALLQDGETTHVRDAVRTEHMARWWFIPCVLGR